MSTMYKILAIIFVAILIGTVFYGAVTATSSATSQSAGLQRPGGEGFNRGDRGESDNGIQFPVESLKNLAIISIVCAGYIFTVKIKDKKSPFLKLRA